MTVIGFIEVEISMKKSPGGPPYVKCTGPAGDFFTFSLGLLAGDLLLLVPDLGVSSSPPAVVLAAQPKQ
jgi:hypothetical protein